MEYHFEWDPYKARSNADKHGVSFKEATEVFLDPLAMTVFDQEHSDTENRWITMGLVRSGAYLVVVHTFEEVDHNAHIRIISARPATSREVKQYEDGV